jgi:hypothetical protein
MFSCSLGYLSLPLGKLSFFLGNNYVPMDEKLKLF